MRQLACLCVLLAVTACAKSNSSTPTSPGNSTPQASTPADVTIDIKGDLGAKAYEPSPATVRVGQTVAWKNTDGTDHTATQDAGTFASGTVGPAQTSAPTTMATAGTFTYHCAIHPGMTGTITVQ